jgi:acetate kinase
MEKIIILSNLGSTSKKYSIYKNNIECAWFAIEKKENEYICSSKINSQFEKKYISEEVYIDALMFVIQSLIETKEIKSDKDVQCVSIRLVVPDGEFVQDMLCTPEIYKKLKAHVQLDPLHIAPVLHEIELVQKIHDSQIPIYLISDSTFHKDFNIPIAVPFEKQQYTIGYHGLACESVLNVLDKYSLPYSKLIIAHLGGGSSVTGVVNKKSVFNSMQFSPLGGVIMSSRSGSVDPFLIIKYMQEHNLKYDQMLDVLYSQSGLLALSGISSDLRIIKEHALAGSQRAKDTIMLFVDSIVATIAQTCTYTRGVDTLVFSGTIGIRAGYIRELVIEKLMWLGFILDHSKNNEAGEECFEISAYDSKVNIYIVHIDEMKEMHRHTQLFFK